VKSLLLSFLAGLAAACGFQPWGVWPLTLLGFAVLLALIDDAPRLRSALARGWWFAVGHFTLGLNWIATAFTYQAAMPAWLGWVAVVLLSLYLAVYPAMAAGLAWRFGRGRSVVLVLIFAAGWIATEWLRATMFTGFAWNPVGVTLIDTPVAYLATVVGTYGLSGVAMLIAGVLLLLYRRAWRPAFFLGGLIALETVLSLLGSAPEEGKAQLALRIVQPNIGQENKWRPGFAEAMVKRLGELSNVGVDEPRLLLWPEAAVTEPLEDGRKDLLAQRDVAYARRYVQAQLGPRDLLLTGGITIQSRNGERATSATNSVFAIDGRGRILSRYDKAHLVPYGEYLPMRPFLSALGLSRLAPGDLDFDPGPGPRTLDLPLVGKAGFQLCYEIIFSGEVVDRKNRPAFLFNPSNDAWFGAWGPPQHLAQARLRALEEGLPVLRSTPTGISAVIDAEGRLLHSLPWRTAGVIDARLPLPRIPTGFAQAGNVLPFLFALLLAAVAIALRRKGR
jgi:apolipoprotein N-acyltransferase